MCMSDGHPKLIPGYTPRATSTHAPGDPPGRGYQINRSETPSQQGSWLPAPAQGFVKLDQCEQFIPFGLCQTQLGVEQVTVRVQRIEQGIDTALVAHIG